MRELGDSSGIGVVAPSSPQHPCPTRKEILREYYSISSLVQEDVLAVHQEIAGAIQAINPATEYSSFIQSHRYSCTAAASATHGHWCPARGRWEAEPRWLPAGMARRCHQWCRLMRACWRRPRAWHLLSCS